MHLSQPYLSDSTATASMIIYNKRCVWATLKDDMNWTKNALIFYILRRSEADSFDIVVVASNSAEIFSFSRLCWKWKCFGALDACIRKSVLFNVSNRCDRIVPAHHLAIYQCPQIRLVFHIRTKKNLLWFSKWKTMRILSSLFNKIKWNI